MSWHASLLGQQCASDAARWFSTPQVSFEMRRTGLMAWSSVFQRDCLAGPSRVPQAGCWRVMCLAGAGRVVADGHHICLPQQRLKDSGVWAMGCSRTSGQVAVLCEEGFGRRILRLWLCTLGCGVQPDTRAVRGALMALGWSSQSVCARPSWQAGVRRWCVGRRGAACSLSVGQGPPRSWSRRRWGEQALLCQVWRASVPVHQVLLGVQLCQSILSVVGLLRLLV